MASEIEAARQLLHFVCDRIDQGERCDKEASMVKYFASEMSERVTSEALQILGGAGYTKLHAVERYWRDARLTKIFEGTSEIQRSIIARAELAAEPVERVRGADGKFLKTNPVAAPDDAAGGAEAQDIAAPPAEPKPWEAAPNTWKKEVAQLYGALPEPVRQEIHRREEDFHKGIAQYRDAAAFGNSMFEDISPHFDVMRQVETHLIQRHYDGFLRKGRIRGRFNRPGGQGAAAGGNQILWLLVIAAILLIGGIVYFQVSKGG